MFRSLNISKAQKSSLTSSSDFDFLMKSMQRDKQNIGILNWTDCDKKKKKTTTITMGKSICEDPQIIIDKISTYIQITLRILAQQTNSQTLIKQARSLGQYLQSKLPIINNVSPQNHPRFIQLQRQNQELNELIHSHQLTNIRMHIRINDQQSSDLESYKQKLQNSYMSYKKLQEKLIVYKSKINQLHNKHSALTLQNSNQAKRIQYLQSFLKKKQHELQKYKSKEEENAGCDLQAVINQQNNELQRMYHSLKQIVQKHQQKQVLWSEQVIQYRNRIKSLQRRVNQQKDCVVKQKQVQRNNFPEQNDLWRWVVVQAGVLQKLL